MTEDLVIHMLVKLPDDLGPAVVFHQWMPFEADCLHADEGQFSFRIWWDMDCLDHVGDVDKADLSRHVNVMTDRMHIDATIKAVPTELAGYIHNRGKTQNYDGQPELRDAFNSLATELYTSIIATINRLVSVFRSRFGQFWALPLQMKQGSAGSFFAGSRARVSSQRFGPVRWDPPLNYSLEVEVGPKDRYISQEHWTEVQESLTGKPHNALVREMITYAEQLRQEGHDRASLVQGVSALELAIVAFLESPRPELNAESKLREDLETANLEGIGERLGLRNTLAILVPLLLSEEAFPPTLLESCKLAIQVRGTVIHKGQRRVDPGKLRLYLSSLREAITRLETLTEF